MNNSETIARFVGRQEAVLLVGPLASLATLPAQGCFIFVDGGSNFKGPRQGLIVGDGDSSSHTMDVPLAMKKDFSDFSFVLRHLPRTVTHVQAFGFLGGRRDHEWINLGEAHHFLKNREHTELSFDSVLRFFAGGRYHLEMNGLFSIFCLEKTRVALSGDCEYPIPNLYEVDMVSSYGLSNRATGTIELRCEGPVAIYSVDNS